MMKAHHVKHIHIRRAAAAVALCLLLGACYHYVSHQVLFTGAPAFTGTGTQSIGGTRYSLGLAGQDVCRLRWTGSAPYHSCDPAPFLSQFGGPYTLTSYVQNRNLGFHETEFISGNLAGHTDNLALLYRDNPANAATWVQNSGAYFHDSVDGNTYQMLQICELAAAETQDWVWPGDPGSHVFISVRARSTATGVVSGGVVEMQTDQGATPTHWFVRGDQSAMHSKDGSVFSDECLHIAVTSNPQLAKQYLVVASQNWRELDTYDAFHLARGAIDTMALPHEQADLVDVVVEGTRSGSVDVALIATLWHKSSGAELRHYSAANGDINATPFLTESYLPANVRFIESDAPVVLADQGNLYTYGSVVDMRTYQKN